MTYGEVFNRLIDLVKKQERTKEEEEEILVNTLAVCKYPGVWPDAIINLIKLVMPVIEQIAIADGGKRHPGSQLVLDSILEKVREYQQANR